MFKRTVSSSSGQCRAAMETDTNTKCENIDMDELKAAMPDGEAGFVGVAYENVSGEAGGHARLLFSTTDGRPAFFAALKELADEGFFCDVVLRVGERSFRAHKLVLAAASPYFRAMFTGGFKEKGQCDEVSMEHMCSAANLETIVDYVYTGRALITDSNAQHLLITAKILQLAGLETACCTYLHLNLDPTNCIGIEEFARESGCLTLAHLAQKYIDNHFCELMHSEEYLNMSEHQLCKLLRKDTLTVRCESFVFMAVIQWVQHEPSVRSKHLDHLFQCVRFQLLPPKFLKEQMCNNEILQQQEAHSSKRYLQSVFDDIMARRPCTQAPRKSPFAFALFVLGGYQKQSLSLVECYNKASGGWVRCADMATPRSGVACISASLYIYVIGGRNNSLQGNVDCADVECFNPFLNVWKRCAPMSMPRSRAGTGVIDGLIYAVGGAHGPGFHSSVERYSQRENRWETVKPMNIARMGHGCAVVNRLLYAIGEKTAATDSQNRLNQVECYDPDQNAWYFLAPMGTPRSGAGVCALDSHIYVVGGYTTNLQLSTCERYDVAANQWTYICAMSTPRSALACVTWGGKIVAIGGYNGAEFLTSVEEYDPATDTWSLGTPMTSERSGHGAAITVDCKLN